MTDSPSSSIPTAYVQLSPPLPCLAGSFGTGFVQAIAADRLLLKLVHCNETLTPAPRAVDLSVSLTSSETFQVPVRLLGMQTVQADGELGIEALVEPGDARSRLANLLSVVRKSQHITICETMDVEASDRYTGFSDLNLAPCALPELSWHELDTRQTFLGKSFALPLLITGMTGGLERGAEINRRLALAAQHFGIPMGVGSQRIALEHKEHEAIFAVKKWAPRTYLIGNLGIAQLVSGTEKEAIASVRRAADMIEADCLAIHANVLQEVVQVEGDRDFRGLFDRLAAVCQAAPVPVILKEVGAGIDVATAKRLVEVGIAAIDVGGKGGTSWSLIEGARARSPVTQAVAATFRDWGVPTAIGMAHLRRALPQMDLIATGGLRDGLSVAKAVGLGATLCGIGLPLFRAALRGEDEVVEALQIFAQGLKTAMIVSGARSLAALAPRLRLKAAFREALALYDDDQEPLFRT